MAVVATIRAQDGATVRIHDDFMVARGSAEERIVIESQRRIAHSILKGDGKDTECKKD